MHDVQTPQQAKNDSTWQQCLPEAAEMVMHMTVCHSPAKLHRQHAVRCQDLHRSQHCMDNTQLTSGERGRGSCVDALAQSVANVVVGLRHQGRVAQVGAVEGEDRGWEQAAVARLHPYQ